MMLKVLNLHAHHYVFLAQTVNPVNIISARYRSYSSYSSFPIPVFHLPSGGGLCAVPISTFPACSQEVTHDAARRRRIDFVIRRSQSDFQRQPAPRR